MEDDKVILELKNLGVKVPKGKKLKYLSSKQDSSICKKDSRVFGANLNDQEWVQEGNYFLPKFLAGTTTYLQKFTSEIGLFRKAGNVARQRKLRMNLEKGESLQNPDPNDVATLLKQWLRELPESLIPSYLQDLFIRCYNLDDEKSRVSAYLLAFHLLPSDHQYTMKHLLKFLNNIALNSEKNKMETYNLAVIMAPNIFASREAVDKLKNDQHTEIVKTLIENSTRVGEIPESVCSQQYLIQSDMSSTDVLDGHAIKSRKKSKTGQVQDMFCNLRRKLLGHGQSITPKDIKEPEFTSPLPRSVYKRKAEHEQNISTPRKKKHTMSLADLDCPAIETPRNKGMYKVNDKTSNYTRRKSFGALWLRRKEKRNSKQNLQLKSLFASDSNLKETKQDFSFTLNDGIELKDMSSQFASMNNSVLNIEENMSNQESISSITESFTGYASTNSKDEASKYSISSNRLMENKAETFTRSFSNENAIQSANPLSRRDAFSIKPNRYQFPEVKTLENDAKVKTEELFKNSNICLHSQDSFCNMKCCKNKTDKRSSVKKSRQDSLNEVSSYYRQSNQLSQSISTEEIFELQNSGSNSNLFINSLPPPNRINGQDSETQSLDVSLNLLLQNICLSPPNKSPEIHLKIGISSPQYNPQVKYNILNDTLDAHNGARRKSSRKGDVYKDSKPRTRLSSNSDSRIPRLGKFPEPIRPNSFTNGEAGCRRKFQKSQQDRSNIEMPCKLPTSIEVNEHSEIAIDKNISNSFHPTFNTNRIKTSDNHYKASHSNLSSSNSSFCKNLGINIVVTKESKGTSCSSDANSSILWEDGRQYLGLISTDDDDDEETRNKRASIAKILKEKPGNVQSKIDLYDSKLQLSSPGSPNVSTSRCSVKNTKPTRASSERYPPGCRYRQVKVSNTNSCDSAGLKDAVKNRVYLNKSSFQIAQRSTPFKCDSSFKESKNSVTDDVFFEM